MGMNEDRFIFATKRGVAAIAGVSDLHAEAVLILFKRRGRWIDLRDPAVRIYLERQRTRRIESATFGAVFELCYPFGVADVSLIARELNLTGIEVWRAASDLIAIGLPAAPDSRLPPFFEACVCFC